jgi:hypothetical protein
MMQVVAEVSEQHRAHSYLAVSPPVIKSLRLATRVARYEARPVSHDSQGPDFQNVSFLSG